MDMLALFQCLRPHVTVTTLRQFHRIAFALLVMTGRVTMLGLSRWAGPGDVYLLAGDAGVVTKAGQHTHGLERFCASLYGTPGPGLALL